MKKGFTLIELLVVISIIALLISILMPALNVAREQASGAVCLNNQHTMGLAWMMYADDNDDLIAGSDTYGSSKLGCPPYPNGRPSFDWVCCPVRILDDGKVARMEWQDYKSTFQEKLLGIEYGSLWTYVKNHDSYHCPGDKRYRHPNTMGGGYRSYSIAGGLNSIYHFGVIPIKKSSQIKMPSEKYVAVEEADPRGYNANAWHINPLPYNNVWTDSLAIWHNKKSTLSFADGHSEMHPWVDESTLFMNEKQIDWFNPAQYGFAGEDLEDLRYMQRHYAYLRAE